VIQTRGGVRLSEITWYGLSLREHDYWWSFLIPTSYCRVEHVLTLEFWLSSESTNYQLQVYLRVGYHLRRTKRVPEWIYAASQSSKLLPGRLWHQVLSLLQTWRLHTAWWPMSTMCARHLVLPLPLVFLSWDSALIARRLITSRMYPWCGTTINKLWGVSKAHIEVRVAQSVSRIKCVYSVQSDICVGILLMDERLYITTGSVRILKRISIQSLSWNWRRRIFRNLFCAS